MGWKVKKDFFGAITYSNINLTELAFRKFAATVQGEVLHFRKRKSLSNRHLRRYNSGLYDNGPADYLVEGGGFLTRF